MDALTVFTASAVSTAGVTVMLAEPWAARNVAVMVAVPVPEVLSCPEVEMVATAGFEDAQVTAVVRFWDVMSLKCPVACSGCPSPLASEREEGVMVMDCKIAVGGLLLALPPPHPVHRDTDATRAQTYQRRREWARSIVVFPLSGDKRQAQRIK